MGDNRSDTIPERIGAESCPVSFADIGKHTDAQPAVIAEIAGRDSIAATVAVCLEERHGTILPSIAQAPTERGDLDILFENVDLLRSRLAGTGWTIRDPCLTTSPALFRALASRPAQFVADRFGVGSPCIACHLHFHVLRGFLCIDSGIAIVVSGERSDHDGRMKANQSPMALEAYRHVLGSIGVDLVMPLEGVRSGNDISALAGAEWAQSDRQLSCVFSGSDCHDLLDPPAPSGLGRYLDDFLVPLGMKMLDAYASGRRDFVGVCEDFLRDG